MANYHLLSIVFAAVISRSERSRKYDQRPTRQSIIQSIPTPTSPSTKMGLTMIMLEVHLYLNESNTNRVFAIFRITGVSFKGAMSYCRKCADCNDEGRQLWRANPIIGIFLCN